MENKALLKLIKMKYTGEELEMQLLAWAAHPTLKSDCFSKSLEKEYLRAKFVKELKANKLIPGEITIPKDKVGQVLQGLRDNKVN